MYVDEKKLDEKMKQVNDVFAHLVARLDALEAKKPAAAKRVTK